MTWTIRVIPPEDAELLLPLQRQVQALHAAAHPDIFRDDASDEELSLHLRDALARPRATALAAVDQDGAVLGYSIHEVERVERSALRHAMVRGHLHQIVVDEPRRRAGIGAALVAAVQARLREDGVGRVVVSWFAFNGPSAALMRRAGFVPLYDVASAALEPISPPPPPFP